MKLAVMPFWLAYRPWHKDISSVLTSEKNGEAFLLFVMVDLHCLHCQFFPFLAPVIAFLLLFTAKGATPHSVFTHDLSTGYTNSLLESGADLNTLPSILIGQEQRVA